MRVTATSFLATLLLSLPAVYSGTDLDPCVQLLPETWPDCLDELLDRPAEASRLLAEQPQSVELLLAAVEAHPGTRALGWWSARGAPVWNAELDAAGDRRSRAARVLLGAGRVEEARDLLASALRLGEAGESESLWAESGGGVVEGLDADPGPIRATRWFPRLPQARVLLAEGEPFALDDARGHVLILDFWASWCEPCLKELPALGELHEAEKERGLQVLLINVGEAPDHALRFVRRLGLDLPVGVHDESLGDAIGAAKLPTVIVADRDGRIRGRWDGYGEGAEKEVASLARRLLGEDEDPGEQLGRSLRGSGLLEVAWTRDLRGSVEALALARLDGPSAPATLVTVAGRRLRRHDPQGATIGSVGRPPGSGSLRAGDLDGDGRDELFTFRPGSTRFIRLDPDEGLHEEHSSPAPLLDLAVLPGGTDSGTVFLATVSGLYDTNAGLTAEAVPGILEPTGLAATGGPPRPRLTVVSRDRGICTLDPSESATVHCPGAGHGWKVVPGPAGSGTGSVPRGAAAAAGRILGGEDGEVVVITATSQLVILDVATGRERYRARLSGLRALAVGDLEGDGIDEIALAVGDRILVLKGRLPSTLGVPGDVRNGQD